MKIKTKLIILFIVSILFIVTLFFSLVSAQTLTIGTNISFLANGTTTNGVDGVVYKASTTQILKNITKISGSLGTSCSIYNNNTDSLILTKSFSGNNCQLNITLIGGVTYRIGVNVTGGSLNNSFGTAGSLPISYPTGNFTYGCFGGGCSVAGGTTIYNIKSLTILNEGVETYLVLPLDNTAVLNPINLTANFTATKSQLNNATAFIWNSAGTLVNSSFKVINGTFNLTSFTLSLSTLGVYSWNVLGCTSNRTCLFDPVNRTLIYGYKINGLVYQNTSIENNPQVITLNISASSSNALSNLNLSYDGTVYSGAITQESTGTYLINWAFNSPIVSQNQNKTFSINLSVDGGLANYTSGNINQTVLNIAIDSCTVETFNIMNMTVYDEDSLTLLGTNLFNSTISYSAYLINSPSVVLLSSVNRTVNFVNLTNTAKICINPDILNYSNFSLYLSATYQASAYSPEKFVIQNLTLNNTMLTNQLFLYDLINTNAQQFKVRYIDRNFLPVSGVVINLLRLYPSFDPSNPYLLVEAPETGIDGVAYISGVLNDEIYSLSVTKNGQVLSYFNYVRLGCDNVATGDCPINLREILSSPSVQNIQSSINVSYTSNWDNVIRDYTLSFVSKDGLNHVVNMTLSTINTATTPPQLSVFCTQSDNSAGNTLTCNIPSSVETQVFVKIYADGQLINSETLNGLDLDNATYGVIRILLAIGLLLTLVFITAGNKAIMLFSVVAGLFMVGNLYLLDTGGIFSTTSIIIYFAILSGILIMRFKNE